VNGATPFLAFSMPRPGGLERHVGSTSWHSKMVWQRAVLKLGTRGALSSGLRASWHKIMQYIWSHLNGLTLSDRGFPPYAAPSFGMVHI